MKLSFEKTIQGHQIEFVRLLYPLRYQVYLGQVDTSRMSLNFTKDDKGSWDYDKVERLPGWVNEITLLIIAEIEENEADTE